MSRLAPEARSQVKGYRSRSRTLVLLWIVFEPARQCQVLTSSVLDTSVLDTSAFETPAFEMSAFETSAFETSAFETSVFETCVFPLVRVGSTGTTGVRTTKSGGGSLSAFASGGASSSAAFAAVKGGPSDTARASRLVLTTKRTAMASRPTRARPSSRNT